MEASRRWERERICLPEIGGVIVIYKEEVTGMIVFCGGWPSQTFPLPFSGWLALWPFSRYSPGPPTPSRVFILAHLSLGNHRVIPGGENLFYFPFFLSFFSFLSILVFRRSQVLTKNLAWTRTRRVSNPFNHEIPQRRRGE